MRLIVKRSGGLAGLSQTFEVDTSALAKADADNVVGLYRALGTENLGTSQKIADAFSYEFQQVYGGEGAPTTLKCGESPAAQALFNAVRNPAKAG